MAAMLDHTHVARQIDKGGHTAASRIHWGKTTPRLEEILLHHFPDVPATVVQNGASRIKRHPDCRLYLHEWRHDELLHRVDMHVQKCGPWLRQPVRGFAVIETLPLYSRETSVGSFGA